MAMFDSLLKVSAGMAEAGMLVMESAMKTAQSSLENLAGVQPQPAVQRPPLNGPRDVDGAVSELANRTARIVRTTPFDAKYLPGAIDEFLGAAKHCFKFLDLSSPRALILPLEVPLSIGTLMTQSGLRGLASFSVVGPERFPKFVANVFEMFTEIHIYVSLQYKEIVEKYESRLKEAPDDHGARYELGRVLTKCGLYDRSAAELEIVAAKDPSRKAIALHDASVAYYRAGRFPEAARASSASLDSDPSNERARSWLWLVSRRLHGYPEWIPAVNRMEVKVGWAKPTVEFEDIAAKIGLDKTSAGRGLAVFDYNNDGHLDVVVAAAHAGLSLYRNNGNGTFTDVSVGCGLDDCVNGFAITVGDYDNDGYPDLFVTRLGFFVGEGQLWKNNRDGTFRDVTYEAGVNCWGPAFTAGWVDYDCDGHLDLFIANNLGGLFDRKTKNRLFHNNGDGTFTEVADKAGLKTMWPTIGSTWGDYNNDGYPDLFLSNAMGRSQLYRNNGNGTFTDVSAEAGFDEYTIGSTAFFFDYDNDGWLDIVQFTWSDHEDVVHTLRHGHGPKDGHPLNLWRNNRNGTFTKISKEVGIDGCWGTMSGNAGDFNNDGHTDLLLGNGSPRMDRLEPPILLQNDGKMFSNITFAAGLPYTGKGHGGNMADLFGDGRLSILVATGGAYPGELLTTSCFTPKTLPGNYLNVRLKGVKSNRSAIGARVKIEAGGKEQHRVINGGSNFGCLPTEQHFGLAELTHVDAVEIWWPSGLRQRLEHIPANKSIHIVEGENHWSDTYKKSEVDLLALT